MNEIDKLKQMAAPNSERIALALETLVEGQIINNVRLKEICNYKQEQKDGDIRYRKKSSIHSSVGIFIAVVALYISIAGFDGDLYNEIVRALI